MDTPFNTRERAHTAGLITDPPLVVDLVCLGASGLAYQQHALRKGDSPLSAPCETWTLNRGGRLYKHDLLFVMDDLPGEASQDPEYGQFLRTTPCITSTAYPDSFPLAHAYPIDYFRAEFEQHHHYMHNSLPYIIAYAIMLEVLELRIWGADYTRPDGSVIEDARANVEYWIALARERGMRVGVPSTTTLLGNQAHPGEWWYGYATGKPPQFQGLAGPSEDFQCGDKAARVSKEYCTAQ